MTNGKISNGTEMCNQNPAPIAHGNAIFIVPVTDCTKVEHYAQIEINGWNKLKLEQLSVIETEVIYLLFDDIPVDAIEGYLTVGHTRSVDEIITKLKDKLAVRTDHGLVSRLYKMGFATLAKNLS